MNTSIKRGESTASVHPDAAWAATSCLADRNADAPTPVSANSPELGRAVMTQQSVITAGQHRSHPTFQVSDFAPGNDEHTTMKATEAAGGKPVVDCVVAEAELVKLRSRDHSVLASG